MARPNQYGFQPLSPEERSAQTQIGVGTALAGAGIGFPLLGALLTGVGVGQTGLKLAQGQELDAADYMNIGAPLGGAAVGQILKRALPALKALKRSNPQAAIKAEQEVAQELQAALTAKAGTPGKETARPDLIHDLLPPRSPQGQTNYTAHDLSLEGLAGRPKAQVDLTGIDRGIPAGISDTNVNLGKAGIRDTAVYGGAPAGIPNTGIAPARGYSKTTADQLDFPTNVQMRNVVGEQPAPTVVGNLAPNLGEATAAGRILPGPGAFTSSWRRNTPAGNLVPPQVRTEGLPQIPEYLRRAETPGTQVLGTKISKTQVSPSSFVSAKSVKTDPVGQAAPVFRPPLPRNQAQPIPPPAGTGPVGGARPVPKAPTKPADDTDLFGGRYGAVDDTAAYNEIPAGIPDTQVMKTKPAGMPWSQAMRNWYDEIPTGRKLAGIGAGLTGVATGMSAGDDYGFSNASPMSVEPVKAPRKNDGRHWVDGEWYDAVPEQRKGPELKEGDYYTRDGDYRRTTGQYKLKSGDTVMDLIQTVTGNKKKQKELLSEIAFLNPGILTEKAFQVGSDGTNRLDSPDAIDPSKVKAGESLVLPPGVGDKLETSEKMLKARRAANMKKRADAKKKKQAAPAPRAPVEPPPSIDPVESMAAMGDTRYLHDQRLQEQKEFDELGPALGMQHGGQVPTAVEQWKSMGGTGPVHMGKLVGRGPNAPARPQAPAPKAPAPRPSSFDNSKYMGPPPPPAQYMPPPGFGKLSLDEIIRMGEADAAKGYVGLQQGGMVPKQPNYFWHLERPAPIQGFQFGGSVGPTDTVPAMLTPGEHVIDRPNAEYVRQNPNDMSNLRRLARDIQNGVPSVPPGQYN